ncbi:MAG: phosphoribosylanthranilate isomerase, partial [Deltaproteobacteria bacterium]|nr:phosphoribosylanthranilate isomerase [Deltaproteobacteria bacterium]
MVKVKICGITNREDASTAVELGADALGFIFAESPRRITPDCARDIINSLPPFVQTVGVFVDEELSTIHDIMDLCGFDLVQLHGHESPEFCRELMPFTLKAFRLKDASGLLSMGDYQRSIRGLLLDTYEKGMSGGTGKTFDWRLAVKAGSMGIPIILSGGLGPSNIQKAVSTVRPFAVDVNSGVESRPGKKDHILMKRLMDEVKAINRNGAVRIRGFK